MNSMIAPTQPMAAACPDLPTAYAQEVWMQAGFDAVAGWPLPNGHLPVGGANIGIVQMQREHWDEYRAICDGERRTREANP